MAKQHPVSAITALPQSPEDDRHSRMVKYLIAMSIRVVCILLCFFVQGWWLLVFAVGAVVLPYLAVILANVGAKPEGMVLRPGALVSARQQPLVPDEDSNADATGDDPASGRGGAAGTNPSAP